jgi:hypothetical protein
MTSTIVNGITFLDFEGREDLLPIIAEALRDGLVAIQAARKKGRCSAWDGLVVGRLGYEADRFRISLRRTDPVYGYNVRLAYSARIEELEVIAEALEGLVLELP